MAWYVVLLRGINVGGKNKVSMSSLKESLEGLGYAHVSTYIASGNVLLESDQRAEEIANQIERVLPERFQLDSELIRVLVLSYSQLQAIVDNKPKGFGEHPDTYHSDAIFLMGMKAEDAMRVFRPREGVDMIWPGEGVIYSQRLSAERTKSRLAAIVGTTEYKHMTIRSWNTTVKLMDLLIARKTAATADDSAVK